MALWGESYPPLCYSNSVTPAFPLDQPRYLRDIPVRSGLQCREADSAIRRSGMSQVWERKKWNIGRDALLTELWEAGATLSEIVFRTRMPRTSVIRRVRKLGLKLRENPVQVPEFERAKPSAPIPPRPEPIGDFVATLPTLPSLIGVPPLIVRHVFGTEPRCRFPIGEPGCAGFRFCDDPGVVERKAYCAAHYGLCYARKRSPDS